MRLHFFEFDPVSKDFHLVIDSSKVVKGSVRVLNRQIAGEIPTPSANAGEAQIGQYPVIQVSQSKVRTGERKLSLRAWKQWREFLVHNRRFGSGESHSDGSRSPPGSLRRLWSEPRADTNNGRFRGAVEIFNHAIRGRDSPRVDQIHGQGFARKQRITHMGEFTRPEHLHAPHEGRNGGNRRPDSKSLLPNE